MKVHILATVGLMAFATDPINVGTPTGRADLTFKADRKVVESELIQAYLDKGFQVRKREGNGLLLFRDTSKEFSKFKFGGYSELQISFVFLDLPAGLRVQATPVRVGNANEPRFATPFPTGPNSTWDKEIQDVLLSIKTKLEP